MSLSRPLQSLLVLIFFGLIANVAFSQLNLQSESTTPEELYEKTADDAALNLHRWGAVTLFHGLPSERVNAITEDVNGALWFGTDNGLVRYDGRRTQAVGGEGDNRGVLPAQRVRALLRQASGDLWIGTDQGAARFAQDKLTILEATRGRAVTGFAEAPNNELALVTELGQIVRVRNKERRADDGADELPTVTITDSQTQSLLSIDGNPVALKAIVFNAKSDEWWLGSHRRGGLVLKADQLREAASPPTRPYFVNAIFAEGESIWLGAQTGENESGLWLHRAGSLPQLERQAIITGTIHAMHGGKGDLWLGTDGQGAMLLRGGNQIERLTFESTKGGLRSNRIFAVYRDREGVVWFGTDRGVCRYDRDSFRTTTLSNDAQSNFIRALVTTQDGVTYAGTNRGLFRLKAGLELGGWQPVPEVSQRAVYTLLETSDGTVCAGTSAGLFSAPKGSSTFTLVPFENLPEKNSVRALSELAGNVYAVVFERGIARVESGALRIVSSNDAATKKAACLAVVKQQLHIGTTDGLRFMLENERWQEMRVTNPTNREATGFIHAMAAIGDTLWVGRETGLTTIRNQEERTFLPDVEVQSLTVAIEGADSHSVLYCATRNAGLYKILPDSGARLRIDTEQGLPSQQVFAVTKAKAGEVWIGTNRGIVRHQPNAAPPTLEPRRMVADKIYTPDILTQEMRFPAYQKNYLLEFAGLGSKTFPSQFQYEYTLSEARRGVQKKIITSDSQFQLTDLTTGQYTITARAISRDLIYSTPFQFKLRIAPDPVSWTTILLTSLLILAIGAGGYAFYQQRRTSKANQKLEVINEELRDTRIRLANITEAERSRIARDLHDQTLADLRHLLVMTDQLESPIANFQSPSPALLRRKIEEVSNEIRHICEDLSPSVLENIGFVPALEWALTDAVTHLPADEKFAYEFLCEPNLEDQLNLTPTEQIQLYRIVQEAINNVCRHAKAKKVALQVSVENTHELVIAVLDDGIGLSATPENPTGHGIANIRSRANLIGAEATWLETRAGSHFEVRKEQAIV